MVVLAEPSVRSLSGLKPLYRGGNGNRGSGGYRLGAIGRPAIIKVRPLYVGLSVLCFDAYLFSSSCTCA